MIKPLLPRNASRDVKGRFAAVTFRGTRPGVREHVIEVAAR